jgi:GxxExxY protein
MDAEIVAKCVLDSSYKVHTSLGPGLLESAYEECLSHELRKLNLQVERQKILPLHYDGIEVKAGYRLDLLVEGLVVVEIKAVEGFKDVHLAQVLTYLKLSKCKLGLLLNFNVKSFKYGIKRLVL